MSKKLYLVLSFLLYPVYRFIILPRRLKAHKEDQARYLERLGYSSKTRPIGKLVWFHAASVGESLSILKLIKKFLEEVPDWTILLTTGTLTAAEVVQKHFPTKVLHQYSPADFLPCVKRFLAHWHPNLMIWVESELWPNIIFQAHKKDIPMVLLNMRLSDHSFKHWLRIKNTFFDLLGGFRFILTQTKKLKQELHALGFPSVQFCGNLKYAADVLKIDTALLKALQEAFKDRPLWVAASTHAGEEEIILEAHSLLKQVHPQACLILVPRHPSRCSPVKDLLIQQHYTYRLFSQWRSDQKGPVPEDVFLVDAMGVMNLFYALAPWAFVGGSFFKDIGGHNIIEPLRQKCIPLYGPYMENFQEIVQDVQQAQAGLQVHNSKELAHQITTFISTPQEAERYHRNVDTFLKEQDYVLEATMGLLRPLLTPPSLSESLKDQGRAHA